MNSRPPNLPRRLIRALVREDRAAEMIGDLDELFALRTASGRPRPSLRYWLDALSICRRPSFWRRANRSHPLDELAFQSTMLRSELIVALRNLRRRAGFSLLNATGLGVGLACVLFIGLFVRHESAFDEHHEHADRVYRVTADYFQSDRHWAPIGPPVGPAIAAQVPEVELVARFFPIESELILRRGERQFSESRVGFADSTFFDVFTFDLTEGDRRAALKRPGTVALSASTARRYFGSANAVGRTVTAVGQGDLEVTAVFRDPPATTHLPVDVLISMDTFYSQDRDWLQNARTWAGFLTYVMLWPGATSADVETKMPEFVDHFFEGAFEDLPSEVVRFRLQPLESIHLHSALEKEYVANGDIRYIYTFSAVALFVLLIAIINFVNLTTARSTTRMREIGVRKTFGARRGGLVRQFLVEAEVHAFLGLLVAAGLAVALMPAFRSLSGVGYDRSVLLEPMVLAGFLGMTVITGLLGGLYPALVISGFRPVRALHGTMTAKASGVRLREALVVVQFTVSITLIAASLLVWRQLDFVRDRQLGFDKTHVLHVDLTERMGDMARQNPETLRQRLLEHPDITAVARAADLPGERHSLEAMRVDGLAESGTMMRLVWTADHDYIEALGLELLRGRGFSREDPSDSTAWVINQAAARAFGIAENPTSHTVHWNDYSGPVVGLVRDYNFASLRDEVEPLVIPLRPGHGHNLVIRYRGADPAGVVSHARGVLADLAPGELFEYGFLRDQVDAQYRQEDTLRDTIAYFSILAILVACLGLFGLAAYAADRRWKEIGIRKVLGASELEIVSLLSREFLILVGIAFLLSLPVVLLVMNRWLSAFAYRIPLSAGPLLLAGMGAAVVAILTVGLQAGRAAMMDPVGAIRHE